MRIGGVHHRDEFDLDPERSISISPVALVALAALDRRSGTLLRLQFTGLRTIRSPQPVVRNRAAGRQPCDGHVASMLARHSRQLKLRVFLKLTTKSPKRQIASQVIDTLPIPCLNLFDLGAQCDEHQDATSNYLFMP